jgi:hypothetical protein
MAKNTASNSTPAQHPRIGVRGINEFVLNDGEWHPHITDVSVIPSEDGFALPRARFILVGPGTLSAKKLEVKAPLELGVRVLDSGELEYTKLTQFCLALELVEESALSPENIEETLASFDLSAAIGLGIRCQVRRAATQRTVGSIVVRQPYDEVVLPTVQLDR